MNSPPNSRLVRRTAQRLAEQYRRLEQSRTVSVALPLDHWELVRRFSRRLEISTAHQFHAATRICREQLHDALPALAREISRCAGDLGRQAHPPVRPTLRSLMDELQSLFAEFERAEIDFPNKEIVVCTPNIILSDVYLGSFEICLAWEEIGEAQPYRVIAGEPNWPANGEDVPHPHVQGEWLCEGDGKYAIAAALAAGRLGDFFLLVSQILQTYNSSSAYVSLDEWYGLPCADCGESCGDEASSTCEKCHSRVCEFCALFCSACDVPLCADCVHRCEECDESFCHDCLSYCGTCDRRICSNCSTGGVCPSCLENDMEEKDAKSENTSCNEKTPASNSQETMATTSTADVEIQPHGLGEAVVPA